MKERAKILFNFQQKKYNKWMQIRM